MFLFIFESIGTSELILIGILALIFLGPRKLPEIARKMGKMMADLRDTTNEFKSTWKREVDFEEDAKALRFDTIEAEAANSILAKTPTVEEPAIREIDKESFDNIAAKAIEPEAAADAENKAAAEGADILSDKRNWL